VTPPQASSRATAREAVSERGRIGWSRLG
jgi:hypothetical protein